MAKKKKKNGTTGTKPQQDKKTMALVGLIVNVIFWPGLGTIIGGDTKKGIIQMIAVLVSALLVIVLIGIPLLIGIWIWALITSINQLQNA